MRKWGLCFFALLLVACGRSPETVQPTVVESTATEAAPAETDTPSPTATNAAEVVAATAVPTPEPNTPLPPFVFGSHYGGQPAGQWDVTNWEAFLANYPDLNAEINRTDYYRAFVNRSIHNQLQGENPPDVYSAALGGSLQVYAEQGLIADITDLWEEQGWDEVFPASVKAMSSVNGRQYFVPQAIQWNGIFYRADVMADAGVEPPVTWDEFLAACDNLNEAGITPLAMTAVSTWPPPMGFWFTHINQRVNGPEFHEQLVRGEVSYTDPRVREVFDYYGQLFEHNCFDERATSSSYGQAVTKFESGEAAMYAHGEWLYEFINERTKAVTDFIRFPIIDETVPLGELVPMYGAFMLADTPYPQEARDFLIFVGNEASQQSNVATIKRLPSNLNVGRSELLPIYEKGLQLVEEAEVLTQLIGANTHPTVASQLLDSIGKFWRNPENIDQLLADVEADRQAVYGALPPDTAVSVNFAQANPQPAVARNTTKSDRLDPGAMIYQDGQFHMFINRFDRFPGAVEVGYATSPDGQNWTEFEGEPLFTTESVPFAEVAVVASDVIVEPDGTWVLYFHTWQTLSLANGKGVIGRATAPAPQGPWTVDPEPILQMADSPDAWDGGQVSIADVVQTDEGYRLYYTGASTTGLMQIGLATSTDGLNWVKYDDPTTTEAAYADSDPVVANGQSGDWDANAAFTARVVPAVTGWLMLYKNIGTAAAGAQMGLATSIDGVNWFKSADSPIFGSDIVAGGSAFGLTALVEQDGVLYLFIEHYTDRIDTTDIYLLTANVP